MLAANDWLPVRKRFDPLVDVNAGNVAPALDAWMGTLAFAGQIGTDNSISGPDGVVVIPGTNTVYVGDVASVKIVDVGTMTVVKSIQLPGSTTKRARRFFRRGC